MSPERSKTAADLRSRRWFGRGDLRSFGPRRVEWKPRAFPHRRGFGALYARHVTQANRGCDFDFLEGTASVPEPEIH